MNDIPLAGPDITAHERKAVLAVLKTRVLSRGPKLYEFEHNMSAYIGTRYAVAASSGTAALHIAVRALGIGAGDHVITTPLSFIASSNCLLFERAVPVFVDAEPETGCIDPLKTEEKIEELRKKKIPLKAILAIDYFGYLADWDRLRALARKHNLFLIEDSCEALGTYRKAKTGNRMAGAFGDVGIFGFYPNKQMTTGEGGMLVTNSKRTFEAARALRNHGADPLGLWSGYRDLGYNYHISELACALGVAQLERIEEMLARRIQVADRYTRLLARSSFFEPPPAPAPDTRLSPYIYPVRVPADWPRRTRDLLIKQLAARGVQCRDYFPCIHLSPFYRKTFGYKRGDFPIAERFADRIIALPFFNRLSADTAALVVRHAEEVAEKIAAGKMRDERR